MKNTLRQNFAELQTLPHYLCDANTLSEARAEEIAAQFGDALTFLRAEFDYANQSGKVAMTRADTRGNGLGMFHSAERLFFSHVYQMHFEGECDSVAARRNDHQSDE